jgi:hypothetical protein
MGDFPLARQCLADPFEQMKRLSARLNDEVEELNERPRASDVRSAYVRNYVKRIKLILAILRGAGELEGADRIQAAASAQIDSPEVRAAIWAGLVSADPPRGRIPGP